MSLVPVHPEYDRGDDKMKCDTVPATWNRPGGFAVLTAPASC